MGITNIHMLTEKDVVRMSQQAQAALQEKLMDDHRHGEHPWGSMRRECPLCQAQK